MEVALSLMVCLLDSLSCTTVRPTIETFGSVMECQRAGMLVSAEWTAQNPGWYIRQVRCTIGTPDRET